jgi:hypothetical protein
VFLLFTFPFFLSSFLLPFLPSFLSSLLPSSFSFFLQLDPILAQGAGLAVEDASLLGTALQNNYRHTSYDSFTVTSYGEKEDRKGGGGGEEEMGYLFQRDAHTVHIKNFLLDFEDSR